MKVKCAHCGKPEHPTEISRLRCHVRAAEQSFAAARLQLEASRWRLKEAVRKHRQPRQQAEQQRRSAQQQRRSEQRAAEQQRQGQLRHKCDVVNKLVAKAKSLEQIGQPYEAAACKAKVRELVARYSLHAQYHCGIDAGRFGKMPPRIEYETYPESMSLKAAARRLLAKHEAWLATDPIAVQQRNH